MTARPTAAPTYRRPVVFCIVPGDLVHLYQPLHEWFAFFGAVEVVLERRAGRERREAAGCASDGQPDRRLGERRVPAGMAAATLDLPRFAERYAARLRSVRRGMPVDARAARIDDARDAAGVASGDAVAIDDLWLRHHRQLRDEVLEPAGGGPRAHRLAEQAFARVVGQLIADPATDVPRALCHAAHEVRSAG